MKRKHAEVAIHWFNGGQIDRNPKEDAPDDCPGWELWESPFTKGGIRDEPD